MHACMHAYIHTFVLHITYTHSASRRRGLLVVRRPDVAEAYAGQRHGAEVEGEVVHLAALKDLFVWSLSLSLSLSLYLSIYIYIYIERYI